MNLQFYKAILRKKTFNYIEHVFQENSLENYSEFVEKNILSSDDELSYLEKELENHKDCCDKCRNNIKMVFDVALEVAIRNVKYAYRREVSVYKKLRKTNCELCNIDYNLHIHHKDCNRTNNNLDNIQTLCGNCHKKIHMVKR